MRRLFLSSAATAKLNHGKLGFHGVRNDELSSEDVRSGTDSTSLENCPTNGSGKETSLAKEASVPIPAKGTTEGLWVMNLKAAGAFFSDKKSWSDLRRGKLAALVGIKVRL